MIKMSQLKLIIVEPSNVVGVLVIDFKIQPFQTKSMPGLLITMLSLTMHLLEISRCQVLSSRRTVRTLGMEDRMLNFCQEESVLLTRNVTLTTVTMDIARVLERERSVHQLMIAILDCFVTMTLQPYLKFVNWH